MKLLDPALRASWYTCPVHLGSRKGLDLIRHTGLTWEGFQLGILEAIRRPLLSMVATWNPRASGGKNHNI